MMAGRRYGSHAERFGFLALALLMTAIAPVLADEAVGKPGSGDTPAPFTIDEAGFDLLSRSAAGVGDGSPAGTSLYLPDV